MHQELLKEVASLKRRIMELEQSEKKDEHMASFPNLTPVGVLAEKGFSESILEAMPGVFYCFDDHLHFKKWNRNFEAVTGYSAEELAKITPLDLFEGEDKRLAEERIREVFEKGESTLETDLVSKDGRKTPYFFTGKRITIDNTPHLIGMGIDITERKQIEQALSKSQNLLSSTFNAMQDLLLVLDKDLKVIMSNWKDHDYVPQEEREGNPYCYKTIMHRDTPCEPCHALEVFSTGKIKTLEHVNLVDGKTREVRVYPILDDSGNVVMVAEHVRDITYKKQAEEKLQKSEEKFRNLFHNAIEGIYQSTPEGRLIIANPAFARILGFDSSDEAVQNLTDVKYQVYVNPEDREIVKQKVKQYGSISSFETQFYRKDRTKIWVNFSVKGIYDEKGILQYYEGMVEDITSKKKAEQKLILTKMRQDALLELYRMTDAATDEITGFVVEECLKLTNSEFAFIGYIDEDETIMHAHLWSEKAMDICSVDGKPVKFPLEQGGLWAEAVRQKKPVIVENYSDPNPYKKGYPEGHVRLASFLGIPLIKKNHVVIVAGLANKKEPYDETDVTQILLFLEGLWNFMQIRKAEQEIRSSEQKYHSIFDNAVDGIFQSTPEGRLLNINPSFARMTGYSSPEELIECVKDLGNQLYVNPEDHKQFKRLIEEHGFIEGYEVQQYRKDGSTFWVSINARCVYDDNGVPMYYEGTLEDITKRKLVEESLQQTLDRLRKSLSGTIQALSSIVETRDPYTAGHQKRVSNLARAIAQEMGLPNDTVDNIRMAGVIHDIGKLSVSAEILSKPSKLSDIEISLIKVHSQSGYDILKDVGLPYPVAEIVLQHHERLDGSGYPQGLKGDQIMLESRILSVADVVEAISSYRPYRPALGIDVALDEIEKNKGILYDKKVVEVCVKLFREKGFAFE